MSPFPHRQMMADKRIAHNALERQRRENLNTKFQELAHTLPGLQTVRRPSKSMIVTKSLEFGKTQVALTSMPPLSIRIQPHQSFSLVSQAKYREMKFQQELNQLRKQQKRLLSENQYLRTITNNARSDQTVGSMASNISYASKESPPLSPESSISGNHEIDFDGSLDSSHMHHNSLSDDLERSMDETTTEDLPFQVPVCNAPGSFKFHSSIDHLLVGSHVPLLLLIVQSFLLRCHWVSPHVLDKLFQSLYATAYCS